MIFKAGVQNGKLSILNKQSFLDYIKAFEGEHLILDVKKMTSSRSLNQNAYYWGVVIEILSQHTGYTSEEMHEVLRSRFLNTTIDFSFKNKNEELKGSRSTSDLNTKEFETYLAEIRQWASRDLEVWIPEPNETEIYSYKK
jgi:hypothetical protein